jgi:hypothetical protein
MSEFLHHVVENREYIQRDMARFFETVPHDPWESSVPIPYTLNDMIRAARDGDNNG